MTEYNLTCSVAVEVETADKGYLQLQNSAGGNLRVAEDALEQYELYHGIDAEPDLDGEPLETFTSLPHTTDDIFNGSELIQNGTFSSGFSQWTAEAGWTWNPSPGAAQQYGYQNNKLYQNFNTEIGASYKVAFNVIYAPSGNTVNVGFKNAAGNVVGVASFTGYGTKTFDFEAEIVANQMAFWVTSTGTALAIIDTVSVKKINPGTHNFVLCERNKFGLISQNVSSWSVELDSDGNEVQPNPDAPQNISITPAAGGTGLVAAQYLYDTDDDYAATQWLIYFTDNGVDPDPEIDTPTVVTMNKSGGLAYLQYTSAAADDEDTLKVLVRTRRVDGEDDYDSENTDIYSAAASTQGPATPQGKSLLGYSAEAK